ncbi:MAG: hypothetical protein ABUL42_03730, partial [Terricaulis silvestris]
MPRTSLILEESDLIITEVEDLGVQEFLDTMGIALTAGDGAAAAALWEAPAFILGPQGAHGVRTASQLELFFDAGREKYNARGVVDTRPEIIRLDEINDTVVMVRVRWPWLDEKGREVGAETSTYTLQRNDYGDWKLRVALMH